MNIVLLLLLSFFTNTTLASDLVISATRIETHRDKTSSPIQKIEVDTSKFQGNLTLGEALEKVPQVTLNKSGPGGTETVHLRGSETSHVLVVLDGLPMNDPINTSKLFDFSQVTLVGIESIEVLFGSHGVLYGSEAIGGVILINTINPKKTKMSYGLGYGSYHSSNQSGLFQFKRDKLYGLVGVERNSSRGFNATTSTNSNPAEADGFELYNYVARLGLKTKKLEIDYISRIHTRETDLDKGFGSERDDSNFTFNDTFKYHLLSITPEFKSAILNPKVKIGYSNQKRANLDLPDSLGTTTDTQLYKAKTTDINFSNQSFLNSTQSIISGVHYKNEKGLFDLNLSGFPSLFKEKSEDTVALFIHHNYELNEKITLNSGLRVEQSHLFGEKFSFKIGPSFKYSKGLRLYALLSSGYKNPTLYQLHSQYGNSNLEPESSINYDVGVELNRDIWELKVNGLRNEVYDLIDLQGTYPNQIYQNNFKTSVKCIGANFLIRPNSLFKFESNIDYIRAKNLLTGNALINRPKWSGKLKVSLEKNQHSTGLYLFGKGKRTGGSSTSPVAMPGYGTIGLEYQYEWLKENYLKVNLKNLLDKNYQDVSGFNSAARSLLMSASGNF